MAEQLALFDDLLFSTKQETSNRILIFAKRLKTLIFYLESPLRFVFGDDIFISYSRADGISYAEGLASKLAKQEFSCRIDLWETTPGSELPGRLRRAIRWSKIFVLVGTEAASNSPSVAKEIDEFSTSTGTLIPVEFNYSIRNAKWYPKIMGLPLTQERNRTALVTGEPSEIVIRRVSNSFKFTRRNQRIRRFFGLALLALAILLALNFLASRLLAGATADVKTKTEQAEAQGKKVREANEKLSILERDFGETRGKLSTAEGKLTEINGQLTQANTDLTAAKQDIVEAKAETATEVKRANEASKLYEVSERAARALSVGELANSEVERDPTVSFRLAEYSLSLNHNPAAIKALARTYNNNDLLYSHLFRNVGDADLSPGGDSIVLVQFPRNPIVRVISLKDAKEVKLDHGSKTPVGGRFVQNGRRILTWTDEGLLCLWERSGAEVTMPIKTPAREISQIALCQTRDVVIVPGYPKVHIWKLATLDHTTVDISHRSERGGFLIRCSPAEDVFLESGYQEDGARVWSFDGTFRYDLRELDGSLNDAAFSVDGRSLATGSGSKVMLWKDGKFLRSLESHERAVSSVTFSPDGANLVTTSLDGLSRAYKVEGGRGISSPGREFAKSERASDSVNFSNGSLGIAFARRDGIVTVQDIEGGLLFRMRGHSPGDGLNPTFERFIWSADDKTILTTSRDLTARVWPLQSKTFRFFRNTPEARYGRTLTFSPDGNRVAIEVARKTGVEIEIYSLDGALLRKLTGHKESLRTLQFSRDGETILTHSNDRIQIWTNDPNPVTIEAKDELPFVGHAGFSTDERSIIFWDSDLAPGKFAKEGAWTLKGEELPPPSTETIKSLQSATANAIAGTARSRYFTHAEWSRTANEYGYVVRAPNTPDRFWLGSQVKEAIVASKEADNLGYLDTYGEDGVEVFLVDPERILRLRHNAKISGPIWKLDREAHQQYGLMSGKEVKSNTKSKN